MNTLERAFAPSRDRTTTPGKVVLGLCAGALTGALIVTGGYGLAFLVSGTFIYLLILPLVFGVALLAWGIGLTTLAAPGWWLLHAIGIRSQVVSAVYGGVLCAALGLAVAALLPLSIAPTGEVLSTPLSRSGLLGVLPVIGLFGVAGAVVGIVVARVAYGRRRTALP